MHSLSNAQKLIDDNSKSFESFTDSVAQLFLTCLLSFVWIFFSPQMFGLSSATIYNDVQLIAVCYEVIQQHILKHRRDFY